MDALGANENKDIEMSTSSNQTSELTSANLNSLTFETALPSEIFSDPATAYGMQELIPGGHDTMMPDATAMEPFLGTYPILDTGEHGTRPDPEPPNGTTATVVQGTNENMKEIGENATATGGNLRVLETLELTQARVTDLSHLQALYDAYRACYNDPAITSVTRMGHAKAFAFALLKHYYPSQEFIVEPSSLGPVAQHGMSFIQAAENGSDIWQDLPAGKPSKKGKKKGGLTKKQKETAEIVAKTAEYDHGLSYTLGLQWDWIKPEDIAGFVVMRKVESTEKESSIVHYEYRPHTYLAIMFDNFDEMPRFSTANTTHRSDVLADALCSIAKIQDGYGILLYGPRIEFYNYDTGIKWIHYESGGGATSRTSPDDISDDEVQDVEPRMQPLSNQEGTGDLAMDMRTASLQAVDQAFKTIATMQVTYIDDVVDAGVEQPSETAGHNVE